MSDSMTPWTAACWLPCPSLTPRVCWNSCPLNWWCHPIISSSVVPFSSCLQSFSASQSFPMSWLFTSGGQSVGASALASILPVNIQGWFPLELTDLISLQCKGLLRVFSNTTVWNINSLALGQMILNDSNVMNTRALITQLRNQQPIAYWCMYQCNPLCPISLPPLRNSHYSTFCVYHFTAF